MWINTKFKNSKVSRGLTDSVTEFQFIYICWPLTKLGFNQVQFKQTLITSLQSTCLFVIVFDITTINDTKKGRFSSYICWPATRLGLPSLDLSAASSWVSLPTHILPNTDFWISSTRTFTHAHIYTNFFQAPLPSLQEKYWF